MKSIYVPSFSVEIPITKLDCWKSEVLKKLRVVLDNIKISSEIHNSGEIPGVRNQTARGVPPQMKAHNVEPEPSLRHADIWSLEEIKKQNDAVDNNVRANSWSLVENKKLIGAVDNHVREGEVTGSVKEMETDDEVI